MQRDIDQAEELLLKWAEAMRAPEDVTAGYPAKASGGFIPSWIKDFEELADSADATEVGKLKASIDSLTQPHQRVIYKRHGIGYKVWRFVDEDGLYLVAKQAFWIIHTCAKK